MQLAAVAVEPHSEMRVYFLREVVPLVEELGCISVLQPQIRKLELLEAPEFLAREIMAVLQVVKTQTMVLTLHTVTKERVPKIGIKFVILQAVVELEEKVLRVVAELHRL
jgi:hypothetical protein